MNGRKKLRHLEAMDALGDQYVLLVANSCLKCLLHTSLHGKLLLIFEGPTKT